MLVFLQTSLLTNLEHVRSPEKSLYPWMWGTVTWV